MQQFIIWVGDAVIYGTALFLNRLVLDAVSLQLLVYREFIFLYFALFCVWGAFQQTLKHFSFPLGNYQLPIVHDFREKIITDNGLALGKLKRPDHPSWCLSIVRSEHVTQLLQSDAPF